MKRDDLSRLRVIAGPMLFCAGLLGCGSPIEADRSWTEQQVLRQYKIEVLPVCYYTSVTAVQQQRMNLELVRGVKELYGKSVFAVYFPGSHSMVVRGGNSELLAIRAVWPRIGCLGLPFTSADAVKRNYCRADMRQAMLQGNGVGRAAREGVYYHCDHASDHQRVA